MSVSTDTHQAALSAKKVYRIGTRSSKLALIQTEMVRTAILKDSPDVELEVVSMKTMGDKDKTTALYSFGAKSLWTLELEALLLEGKVDLIVHSLKDMPTQLPSGCTLGAILEREDPRDALVMPPNSPYKSLDDLPPGSVVGTSSVRRGAQVLKRYPHLKLENARGNVDTRLRKLDDPSSPYTCIIIAAAGLIRMDLSHRITAYLSSPTLLHAVGQGAIGVEIRQDDPVIESLVKPLIHRPTWVRCIAERQLMRTLEGGCSVPIGIETEFDEGKGRLSVRASVSSVDGRKSVEVLEEYEVEDDGGVFEALTRAESIGRKVAAKMLDEGAGAILEDIQRAKDTDPQAAQVAEAEHQVEEAMKTIVNHGKEAIAEQ